MGNNNILAKLEKYSPWIKINRKLAGPILTIAEKTTFAHKWYEEAAGFSISDFDRALVTAGG